MQSVLGKTVHLPTEMSLVEMKEVAGTGMLVFLRVVYIESGLVW